MSAGKQIIHTWHFFLHLFVVSFCFLHLCTFCACFSHPFLLISTYLVCLWWHWIWSLWQQDFGSCQLCKEWQRNRKPAAFVVVYSWNVPGMSAEFPRERQIMVWQEGMVTTGYSEVCHFKSCNFLYESFFKKGWITTSSSLTMGPASAHQCCDWIWGGCTFLMVTGGEYHTFQKNIQQSLGKKAKGHIKYICNFHSWSSMEAAREIIWYFSNE